MVVSDVIIFLAYQLWDPDDPRDADDVKLEYRSCFAEFWANYDNVVNKYVFPTPTDPLPFSRCNCEDPQSIISIHSLMSQDKLPMDHLLRSLTSQHKYLYGVQFHCSLSKFTW